jgi:DNA-binding transcriptional LysR family regulator
MSFIPDPIDPRTLRALVAVASEGSFRGAARTLGYTQSAVSHQIASLERRVGAPLFVRPGGRRRVVLTPVGELAHQHAQRLLLANRAFDEDIRAALAEERETLRIGTSQSASHLLAKPLAQLGRQRPGVEVSLSNIATSDALAHQLDQGQLDIGLYVNVEPDDRLVITPLFEDAWMILTHREDPLARSGWTTLDALHGVDMIAWHNRWKAQTNLEQLWRRRQIRPRIIYRTDDNLMIQRLVVNRLGSACLGALSVEHLIDPCLRRISIRDDLPARTLVLCHARARQPPPVALVVIEAIQSAARPAYGFQDGVA